MSSHFSCIPSVAKNVSYWLNLSILLLDAFYCSCLSSFPSAPHLGHAELIPHQPNLWYCPHPGSQLQTPLLPTSRAGWKQKLKKSTQIKEPHGPASVIWRSAWPVLAIPPYQGGWAATIGPWQIFHDLANVTVHVQAELVYGPAVGRTERSKAFRYQIISSSIG